MNIVRYDKTQWDLVSESIHEMVFEEKRPAVLNRYDFTLAVWEESKPIGYIMFRETDSESVYISYGGILKESRNSDDSKKAFIMILGQIKETYKRANMLVENVNIFMLKKALNAGFIPVGITNYCGHTYVDLRMEF